MPMKAIRAFVFVSALLGFAFTAFSGQHGPFGRYTGPNSLGPYRHNRNNTVKSVLAALGATASKRDTYCFLDIEHGLYLYARPDEHDSSLVSSVFLSSFPNCRHLPVIPATIDPTVWRTPEGIGIGSTKSEVLRAYPQPVFRDTIEPGKSAYLIAGIRDTELTKAFVGDSSYLYSCLLDEKHGCNDDERVADLGFAKGKLIWFSISDSE